MRFPTVTLRTGLGLTIVMMGLFTIALVFLSEEIYRNHAIENQRAALVDLVELKTDDLLQVLGSNAGRLGLELQHDQNFRAAFKSRDRNALEELLDNRFHQYFVTAGILKLNQLKVYDRDFNLVTGSTVGQLVPAAGSECTSITAATQSRSGAERLKPVTRLCKSGDQPYLTVLVPIGLRPDGYLQVVTNPFMISGDLRTSWACRSGCPGQVGKQTICQKTGVTRQLKVRPWSSTTHCNQPPANRF